MDSIRTRKEYLDGAISHREYYAQFVTDDTRKVVIRYIGLDALRASANENLNDIPLSTWDTLPKEYNKAAYNAADSYKMTIGMWVCIAKEAANQIIDKMI